MQILKCPLCRGTYLHQEEVDVWNRAEDAELGQHARISADGGVTQNKAMTGNPSPRRQGLRVDFRCENNCKAYLYIYQHKGETFISWLDAFDVEIEQR